MFSFRQHHDFFKETLKKRDSANSDLKHKNKSLHKTDKFLVISNNLRIASTKKNTGSSIINEHPPPSINPTTVATKHAAHPRARFFLHTQNRTRANHVLSLILLTSSDEHKIKLKLLFRKSLLTHFQNNLSEVKIKQSSTLNTKCSHC
jgi:hypothetical protein